MHKYECAYVTFGGEKVTIVIEAVNKTAVAAELTAEKNEQKYMCGLILSISEVF